MENITMSYLPSDNGPAQNAMIVDLNSSSIVSSDITNHSDGLFRSIRYRYFLDVRHNITVNDTVGGLNAWRNLSTGIKFGGTFRCNAVSGLTMMTDESYCGANTINTNVTRPEATSGTAIITSDVSFKAIWRIS